MVLVVGQAARRYSTVGLLTTLCAQGRRVEDRVNVGSDNDQQPTHRGRNVVGMGRCLMTAAARGRSRRNGHHGETISSRLPWQYRSMRACGPDAHNQTARDWP